MQWSHRSLLTRSWLGNRPEYNCADLPMCLVYLQGQEPENARCMLCAPDQISSAEGAFYRYAIRNMPRPKDMMFLVYELKSNFTTYVFLLLISRIDARSNQGKSSRHAL